MSRDAHAEHAAHVRRYVILWVVLLVALVVSLLIGELMSSALAVGLIFAIAFAKAFLVVAYYMHMGVEPWFMKMILGFAAFATASFFIGVFPDVVLNVTQMEARAAPPQAQLAVGEDGKMVIPEGHAEAGAQVYSTYCVACHQADGKGLNGTIAANFVDDKSRLAKSDEELLNSITNGKNGKIGAMPPWGSVLKPQQCADVLAYVRTTFGDNG